jgi:hypothetical protein
MNFCLSCIFSSKTFTLKTLLRRHYISHHSYDPAQATDGSDVSSIFNWNEASNSCQECRLEFTNIHGKIRHQLEVVNTIASFGVTLIKMSFFMTDIAEI